MFAPHTAGTQEKALLMAWLKTTGQGQTVQFSSFWAAAGRPSGTVWGPPASPAARRAEAAPASGASGPAVNPRPARAACQAEPSRWGGYAWSSGAAAAVAATPSERWAPELATEHPWKPSNRPFSERSGKVRLRMSRRLGTSDGLAAWSHPSRSYLTQNDPHRGVSLNGET